MFLNCWQAERNYHVIDNFYNDVDKVVEEAHELEFRDDVCGKHFSRTKGIVNLGLIPYLEEYIGAKVKMDGCWTNLDSYDNMNCSFYKTHNNATPNHVHHDWADWSGVVYLAKGISHAAGTQFWKHKESGDTWANNDTSTGKFGNPEQIEYDERCNKGNQDFEQIDYVSNKYNRLILFRGAMFHSAVLPEGVEVGERFNQLFYFNQE